MTYDTTPVTYTPIVGDNGPGIEALIESGERWIKINGSTLRLDTTVDLRDGGLPADYLIIEPADGIAKVTVNVDGIGRDPVTPSNPSYAGFGYEGNRTTASYLSSSVTAGSITLPVNSDAGYTAGDWINVSNASVVPGVTLQPLDGPGAKYKVISKAANVLTLDRRTERDHPNNATVSKCVPIIGLKIRGLEFTGDCAVGIHIHDDINGVYEDITSDNDWTGRVVTLIDNWCIGSKLNRCFGRGQVPGVGLGESTWATAIEGGSGVRYSDCGGEGNGTGLLVNYCYDTIGTGTLAYNNNVNVSILNESIDCFDMSPRTTGALIVDTSVSGSNINCQIVDRREATLADIGADTEETNWRDFTVAASFTGTQTLLAVDENGIAQQINPATALPTFNGLGEMVRENLVMKTGVDQGGNFQFHNTGNAWAHGMLSTPGSVNYVIFNLTRSTFDLTIDAANGDITTGGNLNIPTGKVYKINGTQVLGARKTGWAVATGTAARTTFATFAASGSAIAPGAAYVQAEATSVANRLQATEAHVQILSQRLKALIDDLHSTAGHGIVGT